MCLPLTLFLACLPVCLSLSLTHCSTREESCSRESFSLSLPLFRCSPSGKSCEPTDSQTICLSTLCPQECSERERERDGLSPAAASFPFALSHSTRLSTVALSHASDHRHRLPSLVPRVSASASPSLGSRDACMGRRRLSRLARGSRSEGVKDLSLASSLLPFTGSQREREREREREDSCLSCRASILESILLTPFLALSRSLAAGASVRGRKDVWGSFSHFITRRVSE